jgi:hypothetical protein
MSSENTTWTFTFLNNDFTITSREAATADRIGMPELWTLTEWILLLTLGAAVLSLLWCMLQGALCLKWPTHTAEPAAAAPVKHDSPIKVEGL